MKISAIIPHMPIPGAQELLERCVASLDADETIIVVNDGIGFAKAVNIGLRTATGTHLCVINNDSYIVEGSLRDLAANVGVMVPRIHPEPKDHMPRAFFCMPAWVYYEIGGYDEQFEGGYFEDDDYIARLNQKEIAILYQPAVEVIHKNGGGFTMHATGLRDKYYDDNEKKYNTKWPKAESVGN